MTFRPSCDLCGLPVRNPAIAFTSKADHSGKLFQFCCLGCKQVFAMLAEISGDHDPETFKNTDLFKKCQDLGIIPKTEADLQKNPYPLQRDLKTTAIDDLDVTATNHMPLSLKINDMWCPACAWFIETALKKDKGIISANCNFSVDRLVVSYDPVSTSPAEVISTVKELGYEAVLPGESTEKKQIRKLFVRLMISLLLTVNVMMLSFSAYSGFFIEMNKDSIWKIAWPICIMALFVLIYGGRPIYVKAIAGVKSLSFGMEALITAGAGTAFLYSMFNLIAGNVHIYFDTAAMLITLTLLGKLLEKQVKDRITSDLDTFFTIQPQKAKRVTDLYPRGRYVSIRDVSKNDTLWIDEGDIVPTDGIILEGEGYADESIITGESRMVRKRPGNELTGGTKIISGEFKFFVTKMNVDSVLGQMIAVLENTLSQKSSVEQYTEKILKWFVPAILLLAVGTGIVCFLTGISLDASMLRSVTVMVIACPCALGIAIPLVRVAGVSIAGKKGILVRNFESFEQMKEIDTFVFDKTGTLTMGQWNLIDVLITADLTEEQLLQIALGLEEHSDHDIAVAIRQYARNKALIPIKPDVVTHCDNGILGKIEHVTYKLGSGQFIQEELHSSKEILADIKFSKEKLYSPVYLTIKDKIAGVFIFGDMIRPDAETCVLQLKARGFNLIIVSGDEDKVVGKVAVKLGIKEARGGQLPLNKVGLIESLRSKGRHVAMVGDGVNDAPAMAIADVGFGITSKSLLGEEKTDISLIKEDLSVILVFADLARSVRRKIRQNFWFSLAYNMVSIPIAMSGILNPLIAVTAMLLSSLTVIGNTLLLFRENITGEQ